MSNSLPVDDFYRGVRPASEYEFGSAPAVSHGYLTPIVLDSLKESGGRSVVDLGCGNGTLTARLAAAGFEIVGVESSNSGLSEARRQFSQVQFVEHDLVNPLPTELRGRFDVVLSVEVIEHLFLPRVLFSRAREALRESGTLILTTPFHGYWKNLALAATDGFDQHWRPGWDYGHIKFFSQKTLASISEECGFRPIAWKFAGRRKAFAKSMIMIARRLE